MSKSKSNSLLLTLTMIATSLSMTSFSQLPQAAHSQTDYEELIITENNNEQKINQKNIGSGNTVNLNCGTNVIASNSPQQITMTCLSIPRGPPTSSDDFSTAIFSRTVPVPQEIPGDPSSRIVTAEVSCPDRTQITGGGYELHGVLEGRSEVHPWLDAPSNNGWKTSINVGALEDDASLTVCNMWCT
jgi:hypothetical protein